MHVYDNKKDALPAAKRAAEEYDLPFDLQSEVLSYPEIEDGPKRACLVCEEKQKRSFEPFVCDTCRASIERGRRAEADTEKVRVYSYGLLLHHDYYIPDRYDWSKRLFDTLIQATGIEPIKDARMRHDIPSIGGRPEVARATEQVIVRITEGQIDGLNQLREVVLGIVNVMYEKGIKEGSAILGRLAEGSLTPEEFEERRQRKIERGF